MNRIIIFAAAFAVFVSVPHGAYAADTSMLTTDPAAVTQELPTVEVPTVPEVTTVPETPTVPEVPAVPAQTDPVDAFLAQSAFIGNSVGEGLTMYNNAKGKVPLGNATMLTRVSYSFYSDAGGNTKYLPRFNGVPMRAADAVKACGAQYVFICMGTNDLVGSSSCQGAYEKYVQYVNGILAANPTVTVFIESCTPTRPGSNVNNEKITQFNAYMQSFCDTLPNAYYVDIATPLKDGSGYLASNLSSDGSVHLTNKAYEIWANTVRAYIGNFIVARSVALREEREAELAVAKANYEADMKKMEEKKQAAFVARQTAKREAEAAEEARRTYELLNVPDDITLLQRVLAKDENDHSIVMPVAASSVFSDPSGSAAASSTDSSAFADATFRSSL